MTAWQTPSEFERRGFMLKNNIQQLDKTLVTEIMAPGYIKIKFKLDKR